MTEDKEKNEISSYKIKSKEQPKLPKGAKVIKKTSNINIEEIENGYLLCKSVDIEYSTGEGKDQRTQWMYYTKKYFSKECPIKMTVEKELAEAFEG